MEKHASWTVRGLLGGIIRLLPAYFLLCVAEMESAWARRCPAESDTPSRIAARRWVVTACLMCALGIIGLWGISNMSAVHFVRMIDRFGDDWSLPTATYALLATARYGWGLLFAVPLLGIVLFRFRVRGGVYAAYAEVFYGVVMLALAIYGAALGFGALAFVPMVFPVH